ncbi:MAG: hypothetical protein IJL67_05185 [Oscillospiraceae bacterium]|nr:hypothetical protein [Oscillospiraceae bacterium]
MIDMTKYDEIYNEMKNLDIDEFLQIIVNAESKEEREFYSRISDFFIQKAQKELIEKGIF